MAALTPETGIFLWIIWLFMAGIPFTPYAAPIANRKEDR
jgi:hypothetical protein